SEPDIHGKDDVGVADQRPDMEGHPQPGLARIDVREIVELVLIAKGRHLADIGCLGEILLRAPPGVGHVAASDHDKLPRDVLQPPTMISGRAAFCSSACARATASAPGAGSAISAGPVRAGLSVRSVSMSSGRAITTGPGRPVVAVTHARARISGTRSTESISTAHFAMVPNTAG